MRDDAPSSFLLISALPAAAGACFPPAMQRLAVFLVLVLALTGCVSPAGKLDESVVTQIRDGVSTRSEVERLFGQPKNTSIGSNGKQVAVYRFFRMYEQEDLQGNSRVKRYFHLRMLSVLYGKDGRVELHHLYESNTPGSANRNNASVGARVRAEQLALIHKGFTERADLVQFFGNPMAEGLTTDGDLVLVWLYVEKNGPMDFSPAKQMLEVLMTRSGTVRDFRVVQDAKVAQKL
jgi:outer membrane protein assembly factor BamE (lipoprotein component of BamABCDE complex)